MNRILSSKYFIFFLMFLSPGGYTQNLIKNGDFEYPVTDELSMQMNQQVKLNDWTFDSPVSIINHTRLFPFSNFQSLLLPANSTHKGGIRQNFFIDKPGKLEVSFALAASRIQSGKLLVSIDGRRVASKDYSDYWIPAETKLTDHMKWIEVTISEFRVESGNHTIEILQDSCKVIEDHQGDQRDMIEGFLIDDVVVKSNKIIQYSGIPSLDGMAGKTVPTGTLACNPAIGNFIGSVKSSKCLGGFETQFLSGSKLVKAAGSLKVNEAVIFSHDTKWYPYQLINKAIFNGVEFTSTMRLVFEKKGVLMQINLENKTG